MHRRRNRSVGFAIAGRQSQSTGLPLAVELVRRAVRGLEIAAAAEARAAATGSAQAPRQPAGRSDLLPASLPPSAGLSHAAVLLAESRNRIGAYAAELCASLIRCATAQSQREGETSGVAAATKACLASLMWRSPTPDDAARLQLRLLDETQRLLDALGFVQT